MAYNSQSRSLIDVQVRGTELENQIRKILGGEEGRIKYSDNHEYAKIQADIVHPTISDPKMIFSVTHTKPDTRGHSNENKFQLKLGELVLWKTYNPDLRIVIVVGGKEIEWLSYVLHAFPHFFDEYIYMWEENEKKKLAQYECIKTRHDEFWGAEKERRDSIILSRDTPPDSYLRERF